MKKKFGWKKFWMKKILCEKKKFGWKKNFEGKKQIWGEKKILRCVSIFFSTNELLKIAWAAQKSYLGGGSLGVGGGAEVLPRTDNRTDDIAEWLVERRD